MKLIDKIKAELQFDEADVYNGWQSPEESFFDGAKYQHSQMLKQLDPVFKALEFLDYVADGHTWEGKTTFKNGSVIFEKAKEMRTKLFDGGGE